MIALFCVENDLLLVIMALPGCLLEKKVGAILQCFTS